jgi:CRISPR system Cascade subunit CasB
MTENDYKQRVQVFISRLENLDPGDRARLKRCAGKSLAEANDALGLFYSLLPHGVSPFQEETFFLVATLYPLAEGGSSGDLGLALRKAQNMQNAKGLDRRVEVLLDADEEQLPFRLRQAIHFLQSCRTRVDWCQLLDDLLQWNQPQKYIQQRWARSYFAS